jgi:putative hydrolase of the HAD superfamily
MIEGVTFDWWNTVALTTAVQDRRLRSLRVDRLLKRAPSFPATRGDMLRAYDRQTAALQDAWRRNVDLSPEQQVETFLRLVGVDGAEASAAEAVSEAFGGALSEIPPALFPHIRETLETLKEAGLRVGMVSNTGRTWGRHLRPIQDRLGIGRFFDVRVFSDEVGVRKPDPAIFRAALTGLGLPPERVVHVGDDVDADVAGAKRIRMRAVWFDAGRAGHRPGYGAWSDAATSQADAKIRDHVELPAILVGWRG